MATKKLQIRVDEESAQLANEILSDIGLSQSTAVNMFFKAIINKKGLPFQPKISDDQAEVIRFKELSKESPVRYLDTDEKVMEWLNEEDY